MYWCFHSSFSTYLQFCWVMSIKWHSSRTNELKHSQFLKLTIINYYMKNFKSNQTFQNERISIKTLCWYLQGKSMVSTVSFLLKTLFLFFHFKTSKHFFFQLELKNSTVKISLKGKPIFQTVLLPELRHDSSLSFYSSTKSQNLYLLCKHLWDLISR